MRRTIALQKSAESINFPERCRSDNVNSLRTTDVAYIEWKELRVN